MQITVEPELMSRTNKQIGTVTRESPFESVLFVHLRRIVALFNENEREKRPKELFRTSAWMRWYDSKEGIGRVESGTETESNARSNCRVGFLFLDSLLDFQKDVCLSAILYSNKKLCLFLSLNSHLFYNSGYIHGFNGFFFKKIKISQESSR